MTRSRMVWRIAVAGLVAQFIAVTGLAQDAGVEFGVEDDLTVLGTQGTSTDADMEVRGYSVFGASGANATTVTQGMGNVFIADSLEIATNLHVGGDASVAGTVNAGAFVGDGSGLTGVESKWSTTGGTNIYYDTGNVGVRMSSPAYPLDVKGRIRAKGSMTDTDPNGTVIIEALAASGNRDPVLEFRDGDGTLLSHIEQGINGPGLPVNLHIVNLQAGNLVLGTGGSTDDVAITPGGDVGIGTTSPSARLNVVGGDTSGDYAVKIFAGSDLAAWIKKK